MIFEKIQIFIYEILSSQLFWLFVLSLMALGRWLLYRETLLFARKDKDKLSATEKKQRKNLLFWGRGLLSVGLPLMLIFIILSFIS